jgi:hypothetical protein
MIWLKLEEKNMSLTAIDRCRLREYRKTAKKNAEAFDREEAKQRLRQATLSTRVEGPDMDAFLRQLGGQVRSVALSVGSAALFLRNLVLESIAGPDTREQIGPTRSLHES